MLRHLVDTVFAAGFRTAAKWANRHDLLADTDSPAYRADRDEQLGGTEIVHAMRVAAAARQPEPRPTAATLAVAAGVKASVILHALNAPGGNFTLNQPLDAQDLGRALAAAGERLKGARPGPRPLPCISDIPAATPPRRDSFQLPRSDSIEAREAIEAVCRERNHPCAPKANARIGWEAAYRWLDGHAAPDRSPPAAGIAKENAA